MSTERQVRAQARKAKQKKTRVERSESRARQQLAERERTRSAGADALRPDGKREATSLREAADWPIQHAWITENWDQDGAMVTAGLSRQRSDGTCAAIFFTVDARTGRIGGIEQVAGVPEGRVNQALVARASDTPMLYCNPGDVAGLLSAAARYATSHRVAHEGPIADLQVFLHDVPDDEAVYDVRFGDPEEEGPTQEIPRTTGVLDRLKRLFGVG